MADTPSQDRPTLYLIDGHAQMFRAYHAIKTDMTSPVTGEPTNALFAFAGMLIKLYKDFQPTHVAMIVDGEGPTFRDELYDQYKATREAPPDSFEQQIPRMLEMADRFGIPVVTSDGVEADDVMATLAHRATEGQLDDQLPGVFVRLVAKDKDLEQVLSDRVELFDLQTDTRIDVDALKEKRGITPDQVVDYQALIGDTIDNVPGVKGIGPKTAAKLLDRYGDVDTLVQHVDELKGKQKENVEHAIETGQLELSRQLVALKTDADFDLDFEACETRGTAKLDGPGIHALFRELGFNRHVKDLEQLLGAEAIAIEDEPTTGRASASNSVPQNGGGFGLFAGHGDDGDDAAAAAVVPASDAEYVCVRTAPELQQLAADLREAGTFALDTETLGLGSDTDLAGLSFAWKPHHGVYVPVVSPEPGTHLDRDAVLDGLREVLEDPSLAKVGHNLKYDLLVLRHAGVRVRGVAFDTMVAAFLVAAPGLGMDDLALGELDHRCIPITDLIGHKPSRKSDPPQKSMAEVPLAQVTPYAAEDADVTWRLYERFGPRLKTLGVDALARNVEMPLVEVLTDMQWHGVRVDPEVLKQQREQLASRAAELREQVLDAAGADFNPDSPKQLGDVLFNQLGFPVIKKTKTGYSTDWEVLEKLADLDPAVEADAAKLEKVPEAARSIPKLLTEYRMLTKLVGTYFQNLIDARRDDGRVHARFHQTGAATGRLSSSDPNLQNIPIRTDVGREIRRAFVAEPEHVLVTADYSQIELRMLAHLSEDPALIEAFTTGQDIHRAVAAEVFHVAPNDVTAEQRGSAKMINFGIVYGITPYGLARRVEGLDVDAAREMIDRYRAKFAGIDTFLSACVEYAKTHGHVTTILGRRRAIPQIEARNPQQRALGERLAINTVVQGSAADLIKLAMVNLHRKLIEQASPARLLLQIHDELVLETPEDAASATADVLRHEMESAMSLKVPLEVELGVGASWYETK